jgi:nucleolar protein 15
MPKLRYHTSFPSRRGPQSDTDDDISLLERKNKDQKISHDLTRSDSDKKSHDLIKTRTQQPSYEKEMNSDIENELEEGLEEELTDLEELSNEGQYAKKRSSEINALELRPELKKRLKKAQNLEKMTPGTIYIGRIPHGFFEPQMRAYFSQFGEITRLRLSRNKKVILF